VKLIVKLLLLLAYVSLRIVYIFHTMPFVLVEHYTRIVYTLSYETDNSAKKDNLKHTASLYALRLLHNKMLLPYAE